MSKKEVIEQAALLFKVFGYKEFTITTLNKTNLNITIEDLEHISMFNCLEIVKKLNKKRKIINKRNSGINSYAFTKEPKYEED